MLWPPREKCEKIMIFERKIRSPIAIVDFRLSALLDPLGAPGGLWGATEERSRRAAGKLAIDCAKFDVPLLHMGKMAEIGEITGAPRTKVYVIKKSFSGLNTVLRELPDI